MLTTKIDVVWRFISIDSLEIIAPQNKHSKAYSKKANLWAYLSILNGGNIAGTLYVKKRIVTP